MTGWSRLGDSFLLILDILLIAALVLLVPPSFIRSAQAAEWYFYVKNDGSWLKFNLNGGGRSRQECPARLGCFNN